MIAVAPGSPLPPGGQGVSVVGISGETVTARVPGTPGASPNAERPSPNVAPKKKPVTQVQIYPSLGNLFLRNATQVTVFGYLPVVPMVFGSALLMILVSLGTRPPSEATMRKYYG